MVPLDRPARAFATLVCLILVFAVSVMAAPAATADSHDIDGAVVTATNSYAFDGEDEVIFVGPSNAQIGDGNEFEGFGGFDIDVTSAGIFLSWSPAPEFDEFEGTFDGGFTDFFSFTITGADLNNAVVDTAANLVPDLAVDGNTMRLSFSDGDEYADGKLAIIRTDYAPGVTTTTSTSTSTTTSSTSSSSGSNTPGSFTNAPGAASFTDGEVQFRPENRWVRPNIVVTDADGNLVGGPIGASSAGDGGTGGGDATSDLSEIAATGAYSDAMATFALLGAAIGGTTLTLARRRVRSRILRRLRR